MIDLNIPICRAKMIYSDGYFEGYFSPCYYTIDDGIPSIVNYDKAHPIDPSTLEISLDGKNWKKLSEVNLKTDYELDMITYNGYCNGWNNALKENGKPPHVLHESIMRNKE